MKDPIIDNESPRASFGIFEDAVDYGIHKPPQGLFPTLNVN